VTKSNIKDHSREDPALALSMALAWLRDASTRQLSQTARQTGLVLSKVMPPGPAPYAHQFFWATFGYTGASPREWAAPQAVVELPTRRPRVRLAQFSGEHHGNEQVSNRVKGSRNRPKWGWLLTLGEAGVDDLTRFPKPCFGYPIYSDNPTDVRRDASAVRTCDMPAVNRRLFVCVYRRHVPTAGEWRSTAAAGATNRRDQYWSEDSYLDWGDDPAFFCATEILGDARDASWGVCRPDVRRDARIGDGVAFFCGRPITNVTGGIHRAASGVDYFYVGFGTVAALITREEVWADPDREAYRDFFNILGRPGPYGHLHQSEVFVPSHKDWERRCASPMIFFEREQTAFNINSPLSVAHYSPPRIRLFTIRGVVAV
jgi:hypothetical protein